jgi:hypothetical protein
MAILILHLNCTFKDYDYLATQTNMRTASLDIEENVTRVTSKHLYYLMI